MTDSTHQNQSSTQTPTIGGVAFHAGISSSTTAPNLNLSLDELIQQRRQENQQAVAAKKKKPAKKPTRTPSKQQPKQQQKLLQTKQPTSAQKALGTGKAKRNAQMAAKRGIVSPSSNKPTQENVRKEIRRQHQQTQRPGQKKLEHHCKVYVGNLPWEATWQDLKTHMRTIGKVLHADIVTDPNHQNRSKGYGIVEYATAREAQDACDKLNESELLGRKIFVRKDYKSQVAVGGENGGAAAFPSSSGGREGTSLSVFVGNLSYNTSWQNLKDHMRQAGNIDKATILQGPDGKSKGCGIVIYQHPKDAQRAIRQLTDSPLDGRNIFVREDRGQMNSSSGSSPSSKGLSVFVGNLAYETRWQDLKDHMRQAGNVDSAVIFEAPDGRSKGCGIVVYQSPKDAQRAVRQMNETTLHGRSIFVREDKESG